MRTVAIAGGFALSFAVLVDVVLNYIGVEFPWDVVILIVMAISGISLIIWGILSKRDDSDELPPGSGISTPKGFISLRPSWRKRIIDWFKKH